MLPKNFVGKKVNNHPFPTPLDSKYQHKHLCLLPRILDDIGQPLEHVVCVHLIVVAVDLLNVIQNHLHMLIGLLCIDNRRKTFCPETEKGVEVSRNGPFWVE